jgi:hypothetical protein
MPSWFVQFSKRGFTQMEFRRGARPVMNHAVGTFGNAWGTPLDTRQLTDRYLGRA